MFTFDDLGKLDPAGLQTLMRLVDKDTAFARALKGASEDMRNFFMGAMSQRAKNLLDDMQGLGHAAPQGSRRGATEDEALAKDLAEKGRSP